MKRRIAAVLIIAAGAASVGTPTAFAASDSGAGRVDNHSGRTLLPGIPLPFPEQLVAPAQNLSDVLAPITAPL